MRAELLAGDSSATLGLLMKFPEMLDLSPIFSIISDVRRYSEAHRFPVLALSFSFCYDVMCCAAIQWRGDSF